MRAPFLCARGGRIVCAPCAGPWAVVTRGAREAGVPFSPRGGVHSRRRGFAYPRVCRILAPVGAFSAPMYKTGSNWLSSNYSGTFYLGVLLAASSSGCALARKSDVLSPFCTLGLLLYIGASQVGASQVGLPGSNAPFASSRRESGQGRRFEPFRREDDEATPAWRWPWAWACAAERRAAS